jgi:uncharacterized delta-60 repeat protein
MNKYVIGLLVGLIIVGGLMLGCGKQAGPFPEVLTIESRTPALNATGVDYRDNLSITFKFQIDIDDFDISDLFASFGSSHAAGTPDLSSAKLQWSTDKKTATISAISGWSNLTSGAGPKVVEVKVAEGRIKDVFKNEVHTGKTLWKFTLAGIGVATVNPEISATRVPIDAYIIATFSDEMDASTINANTFTVTGSAVDGTVAYDESTRTATFTPSQNLEYNHTYTAKVSGSVKYKNGDPIGQDFSWTFKTILQTPANVSATAGTLQNVINWDVVAGANSYNLYWADASGVSRTNGTEISGANSPYTHTGLINGQTYYYVVTTADEQGEESDESDQVSAMPDTRGITDESFGVDGMVVYDGAGGDGYRAGSSIIDSQGRILVCGMKIEAADYDLAIWRYNADGALDTSFDTDGVVLYDGGIFLEGGEAISIDDSGRILVAGASSISGTDQDMAIWRYNADGTLDVSFDTDGVVLYDGGTGNDVGTSIMVDGSGKILVVGDYHNGSDTDIAIWRYNADGTPDASFDTDGKVIYSGGSGDDRGNSITIDTSGKILVTGSIDVSLVNRDMIVLRYNADGTPDTTFGTNGVVLYSVGGYPHSGNSIMVDSSGRILVAGQVKDASNDYLAVWRYHSNGAEDTTFDTNGLVLYDSGNNDDDGTSLVIDNTGRIIVGGSLGRGADSDAAVLRYSANGVLDTNFGTNGVFMYDGGNGDDGGSSVETDSRGRILLVGYSENAGSVDMAIWRLK